MGETKRFHIRDLLLGISYSGYSSQTQSPPPPPPPFLPAPPHHPQTCMRRRTSGNLSYVDATHVLSILQTRACYWVQQTRAPTSHPPPHPPKTTPHPPTHLQSQPSQTRLEGPRLRGRQDGGSVRAPCVRVSFQSARVSCYKDAGCPLLEMSFTGTSRENAYRLLRQHCGNFHWRIGWVAT